MVEQHDAREALEPCPFCGGSAIYVEPDEIGSGGQWVGPLHVGCSAATGCGSELVVDGTEAEVAAAWNRRATPPAAGAQQAAPSVQAEREAFEAHIAKDCGDLSTFGVDPNRHYKNSGVNHEWIGWQARAALASTPAGGEKQSAWLPIETAPKDGSTILVQGGWFSTDNQCDGMRLDDGDEFLVRYVKQRNEVDTPWRFVDPDNFGGVRNPTHWRPNPASPTQEKKHG